VPDSNKPQSEQTVLVAAADQIHINKSTVTSPVNSPLMQAYQLFSAGDINAAQSLYKSVLHNDPDNRDAMLGLAAVALKQKQPERAAALYSTLLDLNPADPDAIAGLISLKRGDPDQSESELKRVLAQNPQSGANLFELGNLYVRQSRWSEAEEVYFHAYETSPGNADYAFNLAISLDRLGQVRLALDYYQRALALAKNVPGNFDLNTAQNRIVQLQQVANQ
jgi:tetratricopeptide (TPR) repeat protein